MKSLLESIFDKGLIERKLPIEVKESYIKLLTDMLDKYNILYERQDNRSPFGEPMDTESVVCFGPERIYDNVFEDTKGYKYKLLVFFHPNFCTDKEPETMDSIWKGFRPDLWFQLLRQDDKWPHTKWANKYNKWAPINSLQFDDIPLRAEKSFNDYLKALEHAIVTFNSPKFIDRLDLLVERYLHNKEAIPLQDIKRLADRL